MKKRKYPFLNVLRILIESMAYLIAIVCIYVGINTPEMAMPAILVFLFVPILLLAFSQLIKLFMDIEENTRKQ